jgi:hypothetical protein
VADGALTGIGEAGVGVTGAEVIGIEPTAEGAADGALVVGALSGAVLVAGVTGGAPRGAGLAGALPVVLEGSWSARASATA